jgi:hypothetical protein
MEPGVDREWERWRGSIDARLASIDRRVDDLNRMRDQVNSERGLFITRDAAETRHEAIERRLAELERISASETGSDLSTREVMQRLYLLATLLLSAIGTAVAVIVATR